MEHTSYAAEIAEVRQVVDAQFALMDELRAELDGTADMEVMWAVGIAALFDALALLRKLETLEQHRHPP